MVYVAGRLDPAPLLDHTDATTLRAELLDQLIPAVIRARPPTHDPDDPLRPRRSWNPDDVRRWLSLLAHQLDGKRDLLWWHLARHTLSSVRLVVGLGFGLVVGSISGLEFELVEALLPGLVVGSMFGLLAWLGVRKEIIESEPKYANLQLRGRVNLLADELFLSLLLWLGGGFFVGMMGGVAVEPVEPVIGRAAALAAEPMAGVVVGLAGGMLVGAYVGILVLMRVETAVLLVVALAGGVVGGVAVGPVFEPGIALGVALADEPGDELALLGLAVGPVVGLAGWLTYWLGLGLCRWMETPTTADRAGTPLSAHRSDRAVTVIQTVLVGLAVGLVAWPPFGLVLWLVEGSVAGLTVGQVVLLGGLMFGLMAALMTGSGLLGDSRAWLYYTLVARWLAVTGWLPWRLMGFLDDAYRLGLLRIVGPAYQFRHAELQDHLVGSNSVGVSAAGARRVGP
ncbi:MAG: hypothetical protein ACRDTF_05685 [Pseudonocardiaceae bacterium]